MASTNIEYLGHLYSLEKYTYLIFLQAIALSLVEFDLQALFDKALVKVDVKYANILTIALQDLCKWWKNYFVITKPGIRNRAYHEFEVDDIENITEVYDDRLLNSIKYNV